MLRRSTAALALCAVSLLLLPTLAYATSASLYPAGDTLDAVAQRGRLVLSGGTEGNATCTVDAGAARIPAEPGNRNASGALRLTLSTNPTFESCRMNIWTVSVTTSGTWTAEFAWGAPAPVTWNAPARGITVRISFEGATLCEGTNSTATAVAGSWQNGFTSPAFVNSAITLSGSAAITWNRSPECGLTFGNTLRLELAATEVSDATNSRAVIVVGP